MKFLSSDWAAALTDALAADADFVSAADRVGSLVATFHVLDAPDGDVRYSLVFDDGGAVVVSGGVANNADVNLTCTYEVAQALASGELAGRTAIMSHRLSSDGAPALAARLGPALDARQAVESGLSIEY